MSEAFVCKDPEGDWIADQEEAMREPAVDLVAYQAPPPATLFKTEDPTEIVARASETAEVLAAVVRKQKLAVGIQGREHVRVEGWTLLGTMLGVFPVCVWSRKLDDGWEARVEARTRDGSVVGAAEAECLRSEKTWASRDDYALRSMAQTRATSKALRQPLGFVMTLAGFEATPAEEMPPASSRAKKTVAADEQDVSAVLELAAKVSDEAHTKAVAAIAANREKHDGQVDRDWLQRQMNTIKGKLPAGDDEIPF